MLKTNIRTMKKNVILLKVLMYANDLGEYPLIKEDIRADDWTGYGYPFALNVTVNTLYGCQERVLYFNEEGEYEDFDFVT